ncbi:MAG: hypothetical protein M3Y33_17280 [Actinomycetota bacterium]|nr:hypothetical protein [Actinomycetota bacterium]
MPPDLTSGPGLPGWGEQPGDVAIWKRAGRLAWRNRHVTVPLCVAPALMTAAEILHAEHLGTPTAIGAALAAAVAIWLAPHHWDRLGEVAYAQASVIAGGAWLSAAAYLGVRYGLHPSLHYAMEYLLGAGSLAWGIPWWLHKRTRGKRGRRQHAREVAGWNRWWQMHAPAWGVAGSAVVDVEERESGGAVVMDALLIQLWGGRQTHASIRSLLPMIESSLAGHVPHGMTRTEVNKANPSQAWLYLKREDPLREEIEWDDVFAELSGDIRDPAPIAVREGGGLLEVSMRRSSFVNGRSRSGKSNLTSVELAKTTRCTNAVNWLIDMKGGRATRPWLPAMDWVATTIEEARLMLACAVAEVKARAAGAYNGEDEQLEPAEDCPTIFIYVDEAYEVTSLSAGDPACRRDMAVVSSQGQGVEVYLEIATQYGSLEDSVGTEQTRFNLGERICFQTESRSHGAFALGDDCYRLVDTTTLEQKGQFYYRANATTRPEQMRAPHIPHKLAREIAERNAMLTGRHGRYLELYATDWQETYDMRWHRLPAIFRSDAPQVAHLELAEHPEHPAGAPATPPRPPDDIDRQVAEINAEIDEGPRVTSEMVGRMLAMRAARGDGPPDLGADVDRKRRIFARLLQAAAGEGITPAHLSEQSGIGRTLTFRMLGDLLEAGVLVKAGSPGSRAVRYLPSGDVQAAMEAMQRDLERLGAEAREMAGAS